MAMLSGKSGFRWLLTATIIAPLLYYGWGAMIWHGLSTLAVMEAAIGGRRCPYSELLPLK